MGVLGLRDAIESCEEIMPLAKLVEEHYLKDGLKRPLKIAVDEAHWRFNNVSPQQVAMIRRMEPASNPVEKAIFHRVCKLLTLNIRLVFVFDGPDIPPKRGRSAGRKVNYQERELLKEILRGLGVSYIEAPGEAEAECCRLQMLKLVDAVWSEDSDCLMFGCTLWLRDFRTAKAASSKSRSKGETEKDERMVRVVRAEELMKKTRLTQKGCMLFAMLAGGDYGPGLPKCGAASALLAAQSGLGNSLCRLQSQQDCNQWRSRVLVHLFAKRGIKVSVPEGFPRFDILQMYNNPKVHSDEFLRQHAVSNSHYDKPLQESALLHVACPRLNIFWERYFNKVGPILLSRFLANRDESLPREVVHEIKIVKMRAPKGHDTTQPLQERKLSFFPLGVTTLQQADFDNWISLRPKRPPPPYDPTHRVTCEIPAFLLDMVLPLDMLESSAPQPKKQTPKRKALADGDYNTDETPPVKKRCEGPVVNGSSAKRMSMSARVPAGDATSSTVGRQTFTGARRPLHQASPLGKVSNMHEFAEIFTISDSDDE